MASPPIKVIVFGATGNVGSQIIDGLLKSATNFDITAISRPASLDKPANEEYRKKGIKVVGASMTDSHDRLGEILLGADAVITPMFPTELDQQKRIIDVCKEVGVKRYIPSNFMPAMPPVGVMGIRDKKEEIICYAKLRMVPYTIVDMAFWFELLPYKTPSGKVDYALPPGLDSRIDGNGNVPTAYTFFNSLGPAVAKIIADPRTINKYVYVYDDVLTQNQAVDVLEELSGEKVERVYRPGEDIRSSISATRAKIAQTPEDTGAFISLTMEEYSYSLKVRGDGTPEWADYLGYLDIFKLYPDLKKRTLRDFYQGVLDGTHKGPFN
ncbi:hypothetical protein GGTG_12635 [Gaeumannomyces tritici R3-111a-1]|uniref:NmrA-like domain-containing protein n=1 Tax=Gaeumannomyces tritici (strain R3-111a-1) TaxID=644352 RepID=J3PGK6_GAET3|nr:hypothetical protein GGTG_12635 [Gaeumannomyces tritici R3-111a-1]EJT69752.1 hypothetical protein GGTG_12635 [Gaeumannomyces tritici R3-111a-1]